MNTVVIDMVDGMKWRLMKELRGRVMGQSLCQGAFSKAYQSMYLHITQFHLRLSPYSMCYITRLCYYIHRLKRIGVNKYLCA